jgi:hypothetical protein
MDPLTLAFACAVQLSGIPDNGGPLPHWEARELTAAERLLTNRPRNARAMYDYRTITIVSPSGDWPGLVHEMVHHLQFMAGIDFDEQLAEAVEARADDCAH